MKSLWQNPLQNRSNLWDSSRFMQDGFSNLVDDFFKDLRFDAFNRAQQSTFVPRLNVSETEKEYKVVAELPGLEENDFEVLLEENVLRIRGEKKTRKEDKTESYHRVEASYGSFERAIRLPDAVDASRATADFKNGVLTLTIAKNKELSKVHKIRIGGGAGPTN